MAFPTTSILSSFSGGNEDPISESGKWTTSFETSKPGIQVLAGVATGHATNSSQSFWNVANFNAAQEVYGTVAAKYTTGSLYLAMNMRQEGNGATVDGYWTFLYSNGGTDTLELNRIDNGAFTLLGAALTPTIAVGDAFGVENNGSGTLTIYRKPAAGAWGSLTTRTDATYGIGHIGIGADRNAEAWDDFGGGNLVAGSSSVSPSVSPSASLSPSASASPSSSVSRSVSPSASLSPSASASISPSASVSPSSSASRSASASVSPSSSASASVSPSSSVSPSPSDGDNVFPVAVLVNQAVNRASSY